MANAPLDRPLFTQAFIIISSLLCGFGLWLMTQLREKKEIKLDIPIVPVNVPSEVKLTIHPLQVSTKFSYPSIDEGRMKSSNFYIEADFSDLKQRIGRRLEDKGDKVLSREQVRDRIYASRFDIVTVDLIDPQVSWEASLRNTRARIEPVLTGTPANGYVYTERSASDERGPEVTVLLTKEKEEQLMRSNAPLVLKTTPIDVTGKSGVVRTTAELVLPPGVSMLPEEEDQKVRTIFVNIEEEEITRRLQGVPVTYQFISAAQGLSAEITPPVVDVIIKGRASVVNRVTPGMISFGLFGVVERAGETREVAIDPLISESTLRQENLQVESDPRTVVVKVIDQRSGVPTPAVSPTPSPTPEPTATPTPVPATPTPEATAAAPSPTVMAAPSAEPATPTATAAPTP
ncbi:MAG TPA: hypothetical protein PK988_03090 [Candidatus Sumerlaeota bacterium]|nr:hypothetical protein [Candidatus Sumerlaeota bacterium]